MIASEHNEQLLPSGDDIDYGDIYGDWQMGTLNTITLCVRSYRILM